MVLRREHGHGVCEQVPQLHPRSIRLMLSDKKRWEDASIAPTKTELEIDLSCLGTLLVLRPLEATHTVENPVRLAVLINS